MHVLAISGGGFQAFYGVLLLARLEEQVGPLADRFGFFCGTSAGAIVASAAACRMPMATLVEGFAARGAQAFQAQRTGWGRDLFRRFHTAKYDSEPLSVLVREICGDRTFADLPRTLAVTATRLDDGAAILFDSQSYPDVSVHDGVMASAAAPTMFPAVFVGGQLYADGALFANAPDLLAFERTHTWHHQRRQDITMLSIGSMNNSPPLTEPLDPDMGVLGWIRGNRIFRTMVGAQADMTARLAHGLMGERYTRIDADPTIAGREHIGLDKATPASVAAITRAAEASYPEVDAWAQQQGWA